MNYQFNSLFHIIDISLKIFVEENIVSLTIFLHEGARSRRKKINVLSIDVDGTFDLLV